MTGQPTTVAEYLAALPEDRRRALEAVRKVIRKNLHEDYEEGIQYGMIGYYVPHRVYPAGYHCDPKQPLPFAGLASQKNHMAVYLMCIYGHDEHLRWFREAWAASGKKLDMGKSCVRFKKVEDLALDVIGEAIRRAPVEAFVAHYEAVLGGSRRRPAKKKAVSKRKTVKRKTVKRKAVEKKTTKNSGRAKRNR